MDEVNTSVDPMALLVFRANHPEEYVAVIEALRQHKLTGRPVPQEYCSLYMRYMPSATFAGWISLYEYVVSNG